MSRYLSYVLRHNPTSLGLTLDADGFVPLDRLASAVTQQERWGWVTKADIIEIERTSEKRRFEIVGNKIRALYGHSLPSKIRHETIVPPEILYHGTSRKNLTSILRDGLRPMRRQYVHLSATVKDAVAVGLRRDERPVILRVRALEAYKNGVRFFWAGTLFLSESIPPRFIEVEDSTN